MAVVVVVAAAVIVVAGGVIMSFHEVAADVTILYTVLTIAYLYLCINPFIYATKFDPVKRVLLSLTTCTKSTQPAPGNAGDAE